MAVDTTIAGTTLTLLVDEGLGNTAYLLETGDGRALVVDPPRDLRALRAALDRRKLRVGWVADSHLHADFLSGARQLAADDGATILASATGGPEFAHIGLRDGEEVDVGGLTLRALATPGHTTEHLSYLVSDGALPVGVFTGGSLLVGSAARTDLVDPDRTVELARAQYASISRLLTLPDVTAVWPTHGAGSFCSAPPGAERTSTIGAERRTNPLLAGGTEGEFVNRLLAGLGTYPPYFDRLAEANRRGPQILTAPPGLRSLDVAQVRRLMTAGAIVVDVRPMGAFGAGHIPGAVSNPLRDQFATWLGWVIPEHIPVVIVRDPSQDAAEIAWQAAKIGYHPLAGELAGGMDSWAAERQPVARIDIATPTEAAGTARLVLDVRQTSEYQAGHVPDAVNVELGALTDPELARETADAGPVLVACGHGERAMTAASLLARAGRHVTVLDGGPGQLAAATGTTLELGA